MVVLARVVADLGLNMTIAADTDGYPGILGYVGPSLSAVTNAKVVEIADDIETLLARKSPAELELIRESGRWCSHAHRLLQQYSRPGTTEAEASVRAQAEATLTMFAEIADERTASVRRRGQGRLPRPDRTPQLLGSRVAHNIDSIPATCL